MFKNNAVLLSLVVMLLLAQTICGETIKKEVCFSLWLEVKGDPQGRLASVVGGSSWLGEGGGWINNCLKESDNGNSIIFLITLVRNCEPQPQNKPKENASTTVKCTNIVQYSCKIAVLILIC